MADPIVPPVPTVTQPSGPVDNSPGLEQVQRAFDSVYPDRHATSQTQAPPEPAPPEPAPSPAPPPEDKTKEEFKIPSFLEEALRTETAPKTPAQPEPDDFPDELPPEERKTRIKGLRDAYKNLKGEVERLKAIPQRDPQEQQQLAFLQAQNRQMQEVLSRVGVEQSAEFNRAIIQPLTAAWGEAVKIVQDAGADPQELAKAMALNGKAQFEALDMLFAELPESAKMEAHDALRTYRRFEDARQRAVADAPRTLEAIRQKETRRQYDELGKQRQEMAGMFDRAYQRLRDEAKVEVFQKSNDPDAKWWNEQGDNLVNQAKSLFLENTDLEKVAFACLLAPTADAYRKLFLKSQQKVTELQKIIKDKFGNEPNLSESPGNGANLMPEGQLKEDLDRPFTEVFLREFHKAQARSR